MTKLKNKINEFDDDKLTKFAEQSMTKCCWWFFNSQDFSSNQFRNWRWPPSVLSLTKQGWPGPRDYYCECVLRKMMRWRGWLLLCCVVAVCCCAEWLVLCKCVVDEPHMARISGPSHLTRAEELWSQKISCFRSVGCLFLLKLPMLIGGLLSLTSWSWWGRLFCFLSFFFGCFSSSPSIFLSSFYPSILLSHLMEKQHLGAQWIPAKTGALRTNKEFWQRHKTRILMSKRRSARAQSQNQDSALKLRSIEEPRRGRNSWKKKNFQLSLRCTLVVKHWQASLSMKTAQGQLINSSINWKTEFGSQDTHRCLPKFERRASEVIPSVRT